MTSQLPLSESCNQSIQPCTVWCFGGMRSWLPCLRSDGSLPSPSEDRCTPARGLYAAKDGGGVAPRPLPAEGEGGSRADCPYQLGEKVERRDGPVIA